jgi:hypothetical protein
MIRATGLTQEDWCIMEKKNDGYVLTSRVVCFPMSRAKWAIFLMGTTWTGNGRHDWARLFRAEH